MRELPLAWTRRTHELLAVAEHLDQLRQLRLSALTLRREDGSVELARRLESLAGREQLGNVRRGSQRSSGSDSCRFGHVKRQQRHGTLELRQQIRVLFAAWCEFFGSKGQRFVDETGSDELDEALLLEMEEEQRVVVQNLVQRSSRSTERGRDCQQSCLTFSKAATSFE